MIDFKNIQSYKKVPNQENGTCFACGQNHETGLQMKFFTDDVNVFSSLVVSKKYAGWSDIVHGGMTAMILDETLAWTVIYLKKVFILTKSLSIDFLKPIHVEDTLSSIGKISSSISEKELSVEAEIFNSRNELCARARGNIVMFSSEQMKKRNLFPEGFLEKFEKEVFEK